MTDSFNFHTPVHHSDATHQTNHVQWIELFYDLVHVVCIFQLGNLLSHHHNFQGWLVFVGLFSIVWIGWSTTVFFTSLYVCNDFLHRALVALQMSAVCIMAAAISEMPGIGDKYFAFCFGLARLILALMYWRVGRHDQITNYIPHNFSRLFFCVGGFFMLSALLPSPWIYVIWVVTLVCEQLILIAPRIGLMSRKRYMPRIEHLSERFALLVLIVLGEGFFKLVLSISEIGISNINIEVYINVVRGCLMLFIVCWIYFDFVGHGKIRAQRQQIILWWYSHLLLMLSAAMGAVSIKGLITAKYLSPFPMEYGWFGCLGFALYLASNIMIQHSIEQRSGHQFYSVKLKLFGILTSLLTWATGYYLPFILSGSIFMLGLLAQVLVPLYIRKMAIRST